MKSTLMIYFALVTGLFFLTISCERDEEDPIVISVEAFTKDISENPQNGFTIGKLIASTTRGTLTYSLSDVTPTGAISIDENNGDITVANASLFDFETTSTITAVGNVTVENQSEKANITINLTDVNEITIAVTDFTAAIDENTANGAAIGTVDANLTSGTGTFSYSIVGQSVNGAVAIDANGQMTVANSSAFNYEERTQITGTYRAAVDNVSQNAAFTINLNNVDEHIVTALNFEEAIDENPVTGQFIGDVSDSVSVTGEPGTVTFSLVSQSVNGAVTIETDGRILVANASDFDYETHTQITGVYKAEVVGSASPDASTTADFTINLRDKASWSKTVYAGQILSISDTDGQGTAARFNAPIGMAFDAAGNLYIADSQNHRIRKIDGNGNVTTYAGSTRGSDGGLNAKFNTPRDVDVDASGNVWVADVGNQAVRYITPSGNTVYPNGSGIGFAPQGLAVQGNFVYITHNHRIRRMNMSTQELDNYVVGGGTGTNSPGFQDGTANEALFYTPIGIDINSDDELFVADFENRRIRKVATNNAVTTFPGAYFQVSDVEVAPDGRVYAVETGNKRVRIVTTTTKGAFDEILVDGFNAPSGIAIHPTTGEIYISDAGNHVIYKLNKVEE